MTAGRTFVPRMLVAVLFVFVLTLDLKASVILDTGVVDFSATGTQFGRISRDGFPSDWSASKAFPGVTGAPTPLEYETITVNSGAFSFIQITLDDPTVSLFASAYLNSYNPVNVAPNYGLNVNYLGDAGFSQPFGNPSFFQIVVAPFTNIVININELAPGFGEGSPLELIVEGFYDTDYNDTTPVPEPSSIVLLGGGIALLSVFRWKKSPMTM